MTRRASRSALFVSVFVALVVSAATAQAQDVDEARDTFLRGAQALVGGRAAEAVALLDRSWTLLPLAQVAYNLALAYRALGRTVDAIHFFDHYLRSPEGESAATVEAVRAEVTRLRAQVGSIDLEVRPASAQVLIDGRALTGSRIGVLIVPGTHLIEARAAGYRDARASLEIAAAETRRELVALEVPARLEMRATPDDAVIYLDGRFAGNGYATGSVEPGAHTVEVSRSGYVTRRYTVTAGRVGFITSPTTLVRSPPPSWLVPAVLLVGTVTAAAIVIGIGDAAGSVPPGPPNISPTSARWRAHD